MFSILLGIKKNITLLSRFYISFLLILIPFIIVNGTLTGAFTNEPVVWYNNNEIMGIRFITIPAEDFAYAFSLLFLNLLIIEFFKTKF
jgi:lycopene cyclase domain-containing protein